jgi:hypothetical protein
MADRVKVAIVDQNSGKKYHVQLPVNVKTKQVLPALVKQLKLPTEGVGGDALQYDLTLETEDGKTRLAEDDVLAQVGVVDGVTIRITPQPKAGSENGLVKPDPEQAVVPVQELHPARYFTLQLNSPDGMPIFRTDFQVEQFEILTKELAGVLAQRGIFGLQESIEARIIPHADQAPHYDRPEIIRSARTREDGQGSLDIFFDGVPAPVEKVTYLTIQLRSTEKNDIYRFDWKLDSVLGGLLTEVVQFLLDSGKLSNGSHFTYVLSAQEGGIPNLHPVVQKRKKIITSQSEKQKVSPPEPPVSLDQVSVLATEAIPPAEPDDLEIVVDSVEELIKPEPKSMKTYPNLELVGQIGEGQIPIFVRRGARDRSLKAASVSAGTEEEVGGFLIGRVYRDPETGQLFVEVAEVVEADQARGTYLSVDFDYNAWRQVLDRIDRDFPGQFLVGWYHTHLVSQAVVVPVDQPDKEREYIAIYSPFFSHLDLFLHRHFFPDPWHVALLLDLRCNAQVFFAWQSGQIKPTQGYYLYGE